MSAQKRKILVEIRGAANLSSGFTGGIWLIFHTPKINFLRKAEIGQHSRLLMGI
jgi:hypothetical protein